MEKRIRTCKHNVGGVAVAGDAEVEIQVSDRTTKVVLHTVQAKRSAGASATNFQPRVYNASSGAADAMSQKWRGSSTAPTALFGVSGIARELETDTSGKFYLALDGDAADSFEYEIWWEPVS